MRKRLITAKFLLWAAALAALALVSLSLLLLFAVAATPTLLGGSWLFFRKSRREEE